MAKSKGSNLLNYTTVVEAPKTAGEIVGLLAAKGARAIMIDYDDNREPRAISFEIEIGGQRAGFRLPCDVEGAYKAMCRNSSIPQRYKTTDQAKRVAWRIQKDWVEAQMALIECGQAELQQVFLHCLIVGPNRQTLFQRFTENPARLLGTGSPDEQLDNVVEIRRTP